MWNNRPRNIFLALTIIFTGILAAIDLTNLTLNTAGWFVQQDLVGDIFLSQTVAILTTSLIVWRTPRFRKNFNGWLAACLASVLIICAGFFIYYHGPRVVSESDGHASIDYSCILGEDYSTYANNEAVCVLKNIPLATEYLAGFLDFIIIEAIIFGAYKLSRES